MSTRVAQFDIANPSHVWGLESYEDASVLIRNGGLPLGTLRMRVPSLRWALTASEILAAIERDPTLTQHLRSEQPACYGGPFPPISVVVCTRDRVHALRRCLRALEELVYPEYEVIVMDGSEGDETAALVQSTRFRYARQRGRGLQSARNIGLEEARHEIVAFTDDDTVPDALWLRGISSAFADADVDVVTGLVLAAELWTPAQQLFEKHGGMSGGFSARLLDGAAMRADEKIAALPVGSSANMAFRKSTFQRIGMFDTSMPPAGGADLDMFHRVLAAGLKLKYDPAALVWHYHWRDMAQLRRKLYRDSQAFGAFLLKIFRSGTVARTEVVRYGFRDWIGARLLMRLMKRSARMDFPISLVATEIWGAMHSPWA